MWIEELKAKIQLALKQLTCKHEYTLLRWHWVHDPSYDPAHVEIEYKCFKCNKVGYVHLYDEKAKEWEKDNIEKRVL